MPPSNERSACSWDFKVRRPTANSAVALNLVEDENRVRPRCRLNKTGRRAHRQPKAYEDTRFLQSRDARALRILSEYLEPLYRFQRHNVQDTIVFMGSARLRSEEAARAELAEAERAGEGIEAAEMAAMVASPPTIVLTGHGKEKA